MNGAANAFDFQNGFREVARGGVWDFRWEQLSESALHFVDVGDFGFAKAEKLSVAAADDGQELCFCPSCDSPMRTADLTAAANFFCAGVAACATTSCESGGEMHAAAKP